jgi:asparagine synthase (glutamine-hydrolysing)
MTNSIINRGPDDEGYVLINENNAIPFHGNDSINKQFTHIQTAKNKKTKIGLGFRQLKIIDLSNNSHQPMTDASKNFWLVFNGEIYNYKEIRIELETLGYAFTSNSDTEVLLKAYIEWGQNCLEKLNGMFAFAVYNIAKKELFIARDRIGIKPLFIYKNKTHFIFGSTIKSIIDSDLYTPEISWEGLSQNFRYSISQRPFTCFENINALQAGHFLTLNLNTQKVAIKQYWQIPVCTQDFSLSEKKSADLLEESLYKAIKYRLNSDVEVGCFMSGGIDSTTIAAIASKLHPGTKALTLGFKGYEKYNEIQEAKDNARLNQMSHHISTVDAKNVLKNIELTTAAYEEPYHSLAANFEISKMASDNDVKVVLNGLGGDELFGGYDVYNKLPYWNFLKKNKQLLRFIPNIHKKITKGKQLSNYTSVEEYYAHYYSTYSDFEIGVLFDSKNTSTQNVIPKTYNTPSLTFTDDMEALSYYNLKSYIGNHQMRSTDAATMYHSIEGRFPMLDHNFIETSFKIPSKYKIKNGTQKHILREVAKKFIAPSSLQMSKKGLRLPLEHWINNELKEFVLDNIENLKKRNLFNSKEIDTIVKKNSTLKVWQLVSTEVWLNKFF